MRIMNQCNANCSQSHYFAWVNGIHRHNSNNTGSFGKSKPFRAERLFHAVLAAQWLVWWSVSDQSGILGSKLSTIHRFLKMFLRFTECRRGLKQTWSSSDTGTESLMKFLYAVLQEALSETNFELVKPQETHKLIPAQLSSKLYLTCKLECWTSINFGTSDINYFYTNLIIKSKKSCLRDKVGVWKILQSFLHSFHLFTLALTGLGYY